MKCLLVLCWSLVMVCGSFGGELPEVYKPYAKLLGTWEGEVKMDVKMGDEAKDMRFDYKLVARYDEDREAFVLRYSSKAKGAETQFEIRWDELTRSYKCMGWGGGVTAQLYVITFKDGVFTTRQVCDVERATMENTQWIGENGLLYEKGKKVHKVGEGISATWDFTMKRVE